MIKLFIRFILFFVLACFSSVSSAGLTPLPAGSGGGTSTASPLTPFLNKPYYSPNPAAQTAAQLTGTAIGVAEGVGGLSAVSVVVGLALGLWPSSTGGCNSSGVCTDMVPPIRVPLTSNPDLKPAGPPKPGDTVPSENTKYYIGSLGDFSTPDAACHDLLSVMNSSDYWVSVGQREFKYSGISGSACNLLQRDKGTASSDWTVWAIFSQNVFTRTVVGCPSGFTQSGSICIYTDVPLKSIPDNNCDVGRSGTSFTDQGDPDCNKESLPGKIQPDGSLLISGKDSNGNPIYYNLKPNVSGGTDITVAQQFQDSNGNTFVRNSSASVDSNGHVIQSGQSTIPGTVNPSTGTTTQSPSGSQAPSGQTGTGTIQFPSDYARQGEADDAGRGITDRLLETSEPPPDPSITDLKYQDDQLKSKLNDLIKFTFPDGGVCPLLRIQFNLFSQYVDVQSNFMCEWFDAHGYILTAAMVAAFSVFALMILLGA